MTNVLTQNFKKIGGNFWALQFVKLILKREGLLAFGQSCREKDKK